MRQSRSRECTRQFLLTSNSSRAGYNTARPCTPRRLTGNRQQFTLSLGGTDQPSDSGAHCWPHGVPQETCTDSHTPPEHVHTNWQWMLWEGYLRTGRLATSVIWRDSMRRICRRTIQINPCAKNSVEQMYLQLLHVPQAAERLHSHWVTGNI